ncbi:cuticular protein 73D [Haematobia irritans]|uniref:cuticular protein 73D n=1 Tax=Haematobia irritans TaxID=7368 RepID=UPI003F4F88BF
MSKKFYFILTGVVILSDLCNVVFCDIEYNTINEDGSFRFRHSNDDVGSYYHSASGTPDNLVQGRYGSRNPATGQVEETVYTAGPRGFRVNGPQIHRKMGLAQYPPGPIGSPDDPLADPYDDPTYRFSFRTSDQSRSEDNDATGRVRGLYSFVDDEGERHSVRYAAGAGTGFEVTNSVPDNPASVGYANPLYKAPPGTRGKMSVQRGPEGTYKLIATGPDHRRAETRTPDGVVRGTYSFLDDKGVQRTVEYIAGAGIGYRVVKNRIGPSSHINPSVADYRLGDTNFKLANDFGTGATGGGVTDSGGGRISGGDSSSDGVGGGGRLGVTGGGSKRVRPGTGSSVEYVKNSASDNEKGNNEIIPDEGDDAFESDSDQNYRDGNQNRKPNPNRTGSYGSRNSGNGKKNIPDREQMSERDPPKASRRPGNRNPINSNNGGRRDNNRNPPKSTNRGPNRGSGASNDNDGNSGYDYPPPSKGSTSKNNYNPDDDDIGTALPPLITANRKILEIDRDRDWVNQHRDSTLIKNVGKWYIGLPPGQSVRAHVQNIDILPLGGRRVQSPSEALRQDELADMVASFEHENSYHR